MLHKKEFPVTQFCTQMQFFLQLPLLLLLAFSVSWPTLPIAVVMLLFLLFLFSARKFFAHAHLQFANNWNYAHSASFHFQAKVQ